MMRVEVYDVIDKERIYQEKQKKKEKSHVVEEFNLGDALTAIDYNLTKAKKAWYENKSPHPAAMSLLRKIAAICVAMGEENGMPRR